MHWGKYFWITIHVAALGFPDNATEQKRLDYKTFFTTIGSVLPCEKCRRNYSFHLEELPIDFHLFDKHSLFGWTVQLHNIVNRSTGKREWSVEEAHDFYTHHQYTNETHPKPSNKPLMLDALIVLNVALLLFIIIFVILKRYS